jgi:hypothetical protein
MTTSAGGDAGSFRCSTASAAQAEPMFATASRVDRWLLVEQPGPWGPESVPGTRMDPDALSHVTQLAHDARARLLLVRRTGRSTTDAGARQVFLADSRPGHEWMMSRQVDSEAALADLALPARDPGWRVDEAPLYLVCTHGRHDPCCALLGRPVVNAFQAREPERTWECSHVGGDRFGANVVVLPPGLYLGRVAPGRVDAVVDAISAGRVPLEFLRGRSSLSLPVQAAQHFARSAVDGATLDLVDDLIPLNQDGVDADTWRIVLSTSEGPLAITVRRVVEETPQQLTCHSPQPKRFPGFQLVRVDVPATS